VPLIDPTAKKLSFEKWTPQDAANDPLALVLTKSMDWRYEREFRIIASSLEGPTKLYGNFVILPAGALTAIILGCESRGHAEVLRIVGEHAPGLLVKRVERVPNRYKLTVTI
jgi:hypothetical protein